jgi:hypothetical protein
MEDRPQRREHNGARRQLPEPGRQALSRSRRVAVLQEMGVRRKRCIKPVKGGWAETEMQIAVEHRASGILGQTHRFPQSCQGCGELHAPIHCRPGFGSDRGVGQAEDFCCGTPRNVERLSHDGIGAPGPRDRYDVGSHPASDYSSKELADKPRGTLAAHLVPGGTGGLAPRRGWGDTRGGTEVSMKSGLETWKSSPAERNGKPVCSVSARKDAAEHQATWWPPAASASARGIRGWRLPRAGRSVKRTRISPPWVCKSRPPVPPI